MVRYKPREKMKNDIRVKLIYTPILCVITYKIYDLHINYVYFFISGVNGFVYFPWVDIPHIQMFVFEYQQLK